MNKKIQLGLMIAAFLAVIFTAIIALGLQKNIFGSSDKSESPNSVEPDYMSLLAHNENFEKAINFSMTDSIGNKISLNDFISKGKPIVLNFWASWCPPCASEMPHFNKVFLEMGEQVQFMMVNLGEPSHIGANYVKEKNFSFPVFFDTYEEGAYEYQINAIPLSLFINRDGNIALKIPGSLNENTLRNGIELIK